MVAKKINKAKETPKAKAPKKPESKKPIKDKKNVKSKQAKTNKSGIELEIEISKKPTKEAKKANTKTGKTKQDKAPKKTDKKPAKEQTNQAPKKTDTKNKTKTEKKTDKTKKQRSTKSLPKASKDGNKLVKKKTSAAKRGKSKDATAGKEGAGHWFPTDAKAGIPKPAAKKSPWQRKLAPIPYGTIGGPVTNIKELFNQYVSEKHKKLTEEQRQRLWSKVGMRMLTAETSKLQEIIEQEINSSSGSK